MGRHAPQRSLDLTRPIQRRDGAPAVLLEIFDAYAQIVVAVKYDNEDKDTKGH